MVGIVLALMCAIFVSLSQISLRKSYKNLQPSIAFFFDSIFGILLWAPLALIMGISTNVNWLSALGFAIISAILSEAIVFYALSHGELSITTTILATYPVYTLIFSKIINNEYLSILLLFFIILAILGSVVATLPNKYHKYEFKLNSGIVWPFIAAFCIGLSDTLSKTYINNSKDFSFLLSLSLVQVPVALAYLKIEKQSLFKKSTLNIINNIKQFKFALIGGLFNIIGTGFLWLSFAYLPASIASPITGSNGILTVILAKYMFKEKISIIKYLGIFLAFIGIIGISVLKNN